VVVDQKPAAARAVSVEILSQNTLSPEFVGGHKSLEVGRRLSCEEEVLRPPTPPPPLRDEPPPTVPRKQVGSWNVAFVGRPYLVSVKM